MSAVDPAQVRQEKDLAHDRPLISCRFDPTGKYAFASSEDQSVLRWEIASGAKVALKAHDSWVMALGTTSDGKTLITGGCDGRVILWPADAPEPAPTRTIDAHQGWVHAVAVSQDNQWLVTAGSDRVVKLWSLADGKLAHQWTAHAKPVYQVAFGPGPDDLVSADLAGVVIHWKLSDRSEVRRLDGAKLYKYDGGQAVDYGGIRDLSFSKDGAWLACAGLIEASNPLGAVSNPAVVVFSWADGKEKLLQRSKEDVKGVAWGIRFHPEGFAVVVSGGTGGGWLWFYKPDQPNPFHQFQLPNTGRGLDLSADGRFVATAHHDGHLRVWTLAPK